MSAETYLARRCDHHDENGERCDTEWTHPTRADTQRELRRHLKARGWTFGRRGDRCPDHADA